MGFFRLANVGETTITSRTYACGWGVSCNAAYIIAYRGVTVQISNSVVIVNGVFAFFAVGARLPLAANFFVDRIAAASYRVNFPGGYINCVGTAFVIYLYAGSAIPNGLCGTVTPAVGRAFENGTLIGEEFRVHTAAETGYTFQNGETFEDLNDLDFVQHYGPVENPDPELLETAFEFCSVLNGTIADDCAPYQPAEDFFGACVNDILLTGDVAFGNDVVEAYVDACKNAAAADGITIATPASKASVAYGGGWGQQLAANTDYAFYIQARDANDQPLTVGGDTFLVSSQGPADIDFNVVDNGDGRYIVYFTTPDIVGRYTISVLLRQNHIANSPIASDVIAVECNGALCGAQCFEPAEVDCVDNQLVPKGFLRCGEAVYDASLYDCLNAVVLCPRGYDVCGVSQCYSADAHACIGGFQLCPRTAASLCGAACYSSLEVECCNAATNKLCPVGADCSC